MGLYVVTCLVRKSGTLHGGEVMFACIGSVLVILHLGSRWGGMGAYGLRSLKVITGAVNRLMLLSSVCWL